MIILGVNKSAAYQLGSPVDERKLSAQWNAVLIDGNWRLLDIFWACTCVVSRPSDEWADLISSEDDKKQQSTESNEDTQHIVNESFFIPNPDELIYTHFPRHPKWQLLEEPFTKAQYEASVYVRERFFQLGCSIEDPEYRRCIVKAKRGEADIRIKMFDENTKVGFRYMIFRQRHGRVNQRPPHPLERK